MVKIYYDKYGRIYASWNKRNDLLLGEVEVGDTFKILYDDTDCDGCIKRTSFEGGLDDEGFLRDFTSKCFKDEVDCMDPDDDNIDIKYYVIECKVVEVNDTLDIESVGDYKWSMTYSRK